MFSHTEASTSSGSPISASSALRPWRTGCVQVRSCRFLRLFVDREIDDPGKGKTGFRPSETQLGTDDVRARPATPSNDLGFGRKEERGHRRRSTQLLADRFGPVRGPPCSLAAGQPLPCRLRLRRLLSLVGPLCTVMPSSLARRLNRGFLAPERYSPCRAVPSFARTRSMRSQNFGCRLWARGWREISVPSCSSSLQRWQSPATGEMGR